MKSLTVPIGTNYSFDLHSSSHSVLLTILREYLLQGDYVSFRRSLK